MRLPRHPPAASGHGAASQPRDARAGPATGETAGGRAAGPGSRARQRVADRGGTRLEYRFAAIGRWPPLRAGDDLVGARPDAGRGAWSSPRTADVGRRSDAALLAVPAHRDTLASPSRRCVWRWRFVPRARAAAFAELAFGGLFTADPVPEGTEAANFLTHGAFGVRWRPGRRTSWVTAYRFQHISNGNQLTTNPGVNAHVLWIGRCTRALRCAAPAAPAAPARTCLLSLSSHAARPAAGSDEPPPRFVRHRRARRYILRVLDDGSCG